MGSIREIFDLAQQLDITKEEIMDFKEDSDVSFTWEELKKVLKATLKIKNILDNRIWYYELTDYYEGGFGRRYTADAITMRISVKNDNNLEVEMLVMPGQIEVCIVDQDYGGYIDELTGVYNDSIAEIRLACDYAVYADNPYDDK